MSIDWHGEIAKEKRDTAARRATFRAFIIGAIVALILIGGLVDYILSQPSPALVIVILSATPASSATGDPRTATAQEIIARTEIAIALTSGAPTLIPTIVPTTAGAKMPSSLPDQLAEYAYNAKLPADQRLTFYRWLPIAAKPGYRLLGAQWNNSKRLLYIAHARTETLSSCNSPANADDAYWMVDVAHYPASVVGQLRYPMMVSPKRIAFDAQDNAYILAADCKQQTYAIFKFNTRGQWVDTFPLIGGTDLTVTADNRLLVAVSGYADTSIPQAHLLELHSNPDGGLQQVADFNSGNPSGFFRALLASTSLYTVWDEPKVPERLSQRPLPAAVVTDIPSRSTQSAIAFEDPSTGVVVPSLDNLVSENGQLFGLSLTRRAIMQLPLAADPFLVFPINRMYARTFAIAPDFWLLAGPPDPLP